MPALCREFCGVGIRTPEALANLIILRDEMTIALGLVHGTHQPSANACAYHRALELCESFRDLKHELACRRCCVDALLIEIHVNTPGLQALDRAEQIDERWAYRL
jgi:hypothetical protein